MKDKLKIIGAIINSYAFLIIAYIVSLIVFSITGSKTILSVSCGIMLFCCLASGSSFDMGDDKEKKDIYHFLQAVAVVSILFMFQHFLHIFTNIAD